ncbi:LLM class flavin-dependent oxidoreductase [Rhodococcus koreensis]
MTTTTPNSTSVNDHVDESEYEATEPWKTPALNEVNDFKLALFSINTARGTSFSHADGLIRVTWDEQLRLATLADRAGIDAIIPIAHWKHYLDADPYLDRIFEPFTWAAALASVTNRAQIFATVQVPLYHPMMVAKMATTIDHISGGRAALNIVAGWNDRELAMFGVPPAKHDQRYAYAEEWMDLLLRVFDEQQPFDFDGEYVKGEGIISRPRPLQRPRPVIMSAGSSSAGRKFAGRYADMIFCFFQGLDDLRPAVEQARADAKAVSGREVKVFGHGYIVCADTEAEARRLFEQVSLESIDLDTVSAFTNLGEGKVRSADIFQDKEALATAQKCAVGPYAFPLVGTAEQIAARIVEIRQSGLDGMAVSFPHYEEGLLRYENEIRPLLIEAGVRDV